MLKYYTKEFWEGGDQQSIAENIDSWLNLFEKMKPTSDYNFKIVGYVTFKMYIVITVEVFEKS